MGPDEYLGVDMGGGDTQDNLDNSGKVLSRRCLVSLGHKIADRRPRIDNCNERRCTLLRSDMRVGQLTAGVLTPSRNQVSRVPLPLTSIGPRAVVLKSP